MNQQGKAKVDDWGCIPVTSVVPVGKTGGGGENKEQEKKKEIGGGGIALAIVEKEADAVVKVEAIAAGGGGQGGKQVVEKALGGRAGVAIGGAGGDGWEVKDGDILETEELKPVEDFDLLGLSDSLLRGIYAYGFEKPTMIQGKAIPALLAGRDVIAQAQSGTGKTGAFSIAALQLLDPTKNVCQAMIVTPVRELASQSSKVLSALGDYMRPNSEPVICHNFVGGDSTQSEYHNKALIDKGVQVVVGTPGRLASLVKRGFLKLNNMKLLIIDEADEMLKEGHTENVKLIVNAMAPGAQIACFSATMPQDVLEMTKLFLVNPVRILIKKHEIALQGLKQFKVELENEHQKISCLYDLLSHMFFSQCIIFANSIDKVSWLYAQLSSANHFCCTVHSAMEQSERNASCDKFRSGETRILIATDALARGFDVQQVSLVINYDVPNCSERGARENYIHRVGRAARMGRKGTAINFCTGAKDRGNMQDISFFYNIEIPYLPQEVVDES